MPLIAQSRINAILKNSFLFRGWPEEELARLAAASHLRTAERGDVLFGRGDPCVSLAMLLDGQVQMFRTGEDGLEIVLHAIQAPGLVGCAALFLGRAFPASSRVVSVSAQILQIEGTSLIDLMKRRPELAFRMIGGLASRLAELADRIENRRGGSSAGRVADWLLARIPVSGMAPCPVPLPGAKKDLAGELGMTPETLSRCLRRLAVQDVIRVDKRVVHVLLPERLKEVAGG